MRKVFPFMIAICLTGTSIHAQNNVSKEEAEQFFNQIKSKLESSNGAQSADNFVMFYDDGFKGSTTTLRPNRAPVIKTHDLGTLLLEFNRNLNNQSQYNYRNFSLEGVILNEPYAVISVKHDYFITREGDVRLEGTSVTNHVLKKIKGQVKIISSTTLSNIPQEYVGDCFCRFYNEKNDYSITVEFPYGHELEKIVESIYKIPGDRNLFVYQGKIYRWDGDNTVFRYNATTDSDVSEISKANSLEMAMAKVLQYVSYREVCLSMRRYAQQG